MALAEARAAWQKTANRCCLVQEDAKRAPKLACCPSIIEKQPDLGPSNVTCGQNNKPATDLSLLPFDYRNSNLSPNSKWWLQHQQPNYGYHKKVSMDEQLNPNNSGEKTCRISQTNESYGSSFDDQFTNFATADKNDFSCVNEKESTVRYAQNWQGLSEEEVEEDVGELEAEDIFICLESEKLFVPCFGYSKKSARTGLPERNSPWWRTADADELALLVAQSSLDRVENCDLPWPQTTRDNRKDSDARIHYIERVGKSAPSSVKKTCNDDVQRVCKDPLHLSPKDQALAGRNKPSSNKNRNRPTRDISPGKNEFYDDDKSKAQILEALRHSQTRAREAEKAAERVCAEKEHVLTLLIKQASQIFAYKQWLHLLQLENMYLQLRSKKGTVQPSVSFVFPFLLSPRRPQTRGRKIPKRTDNKSFNRKRATTCNSPCRDNVSKCAAAVVFALGLSLASAGLLLGWALW